MSFLYYRTIFPALVPLLEFMPGITSLCLTKKSSCVCKTFLSFVNVSLMLIFKSCKIRK